MFFIGGILGILSKLFDIHTVLLGTLIFIFSDTKKKAMMNILPFCIGMLIAYYLTAHFIHSVYGWVYIKGWTIEFIKLQ